MTIGVSIFLIAVGAILKFAVADELEGVDLGTIGVILMVVGALGLLIALIIEGTRRGRAAGGTRVVERDVYDDRL